MTEWGFSKGDCRRNLERGQSQEGMRQALCACGVPGTTVFLHFPTHSSALKVLLFPFCQEGGGALSPSPRWEDGARGGVYVVPIRAL